jgi:hypothetical protein
MKKLKLGPKVKFKKAKLPIKKRLVGNYTILEPLSVSKHAKDLYLEYSKDKKNIIWTYLPYGPFRSLFKFYKLA